MLVFAFQITHKHEVQFATIAMAGSKNFFKGYSFVVIAIYILYLQSAGAVPRMCKVKIINNLWNCTGEQHVMLVLFEH